MFVRRLVERGSELVRRVGHELAAGAGRFLECAEHRVEARREPADLVATSDLDPAGEVAGLGHVFSGLGQPTDGSERGPRDRQAEPCRDEDATERDHDQEPLDPVERVIRLLERARNLDREARNLAVPERDHADVRAVGVCVSVKKVPCSPRATWIARSSTGSARCWPGRRGPAVGAHDLRVSAEDAELRGSLADLERRSARDPVQLFLSESSTLE